MPENKIDNANCQTPTFYYVGVFAYLQDKQNTLYQAGDDMQTENEYLRAVRLLPPSLRDIAQSIPPEAAASAEEIRLRTGGPLCVVTADGEIAVGTNHMVTPAELQLVLEIATRASAHSYVDSIRQGFITAESGVRVGLCGLAITENGAVSGIRRIFSLCIRIPREKRGIAEEVNKKLTVNGFDSAIILSPPGGGKTTLLRELTRLISNAGTRISLIDERLELSGAFEGRTCFDIGAKTDVLAGAPKAAGVMMALRSMSPQIIAFDEITAEEDIQAAILAANCGVKLLATAHAGSVSDLKTRPLYRPLIENMIFRRAVVINHNCARRYYTVEELL